MLTDDKIIHIIKAYEREYAILRKNSGAFHKRLAAKILDTVYEEKIQVLDFFLREIKYNENELWGTALIIIQEMKAVELCPRIVDIYNEVGKYKDEEWKKFVMILLMQFRYLPAKDLYRNYVSEFMNKNDNSFFLLVQYCNVNPLEALPLLSNDLVNNVLSNNLISKPAEKIGNTLQGISLQISYLVTHFKKNPKDYLPELLNLVYAKNVKVGDYLYNEIKKYMNSEFNSLT